MKPFRDHVGIAIDGGGIRGLIVTQALAVLEEFTGQSVHDTFRLSVGTSTGSIISAGIATGLSAGKMTELYMQMGNTIFPKTLRSVLWPLTKYRYSDEPLATALNDQFDGQLMGSLWNEGRKSDLVITAYDLQENRTRFIKPWKEEYAGWPIAKAVQASCTVPTYFPIVENRYIDGGVGSYGNPCYIAAFEARECLGWDPVDTTIISIGTGRAPYAHDPEKTAGLWAWNWIGKVVDVFTQSAYDQQVHLVKTYFDKLDFRRFQVNLREPIAMDDTSKYEQMVAYGTRLGRMILNDEFDRAQDIVVKKAHLP
jgi:hypothetical protein